MGLLTAPTCRWCNRKSGQSCPRAPRTAIAPRPTGSVKLVSNDFPVFHLTMTTPQRYQTFVERSITPSGMGIEIYFVLDSQTNERVAKCRCFLIGVAALGCFIGYNLWNT